MGIDSTGDGLVDVTFLRFRDLAVRVPLDGSVGPGMQVAVYDAVGKAFAAAVPPGVGPGGLFHIRVPVLPWTQPAAAAAAAAAEVTAASVAAAAAEPTGAAAAGAAGFSTSLEGVDITEGDTSEHAVTEAFTEMDRDCDGELTRFEVIKGCSSSAKACHSQQ